jgi:hypothetical protein
MNPTAVMGDPVAGLGVAAKTGQSPHRPPSTFVQLEPLYWKS